MTAPDRNPENLLDDLASASCRAIQDFRARISGAELRKAVQMISVARSIHVIGKHQSYALAATLCDGLQRQGCRCHLVDPADGNDLQWLHEMYVDDLLVAIHLPGRTWPVAGFAGAAQNQGIPVLGITDSAIGPLARASDLCFVAPATGDKNLPPLAPYLVLIHSLLMGLRRYTSQGEGR